MARTRARTRWTELLDGPLAGHRTTAYVTNGELSVYRASSDDPAVREEHIYRVVEFGKARWDRHAGNEPMPR